MSIIRKYKKANSLKNSIPVFVDALINYPSFKMVRLTYFSIEASTNKDNWIIDLKNHRIPFKPISMQGIINKPLRGHQFKSFNSIDRLFSKIESNEDFIIDINDIWFPQQIFEKEPIRGEVYRIPFELFDLALKFRCDIIKKNDFLSFCEAYPYKFPLSEIESQSFKEWSKQKVDTAKKLYPKNSTLKLSFIENIK